MLFFVCLLGGGGGGGVRGAGGAFTFSVKLGNVLLTFLVFPTVSLKN